MIRLSLAVMALALMTACGSGEPDSDSPAAQPTETATDDASATPTESTAPVLDTISYKGTLKSTPKGPGSTQKLQLGIYCALPEGEDCNVVGFSVGNHQVIDLARTAPGSFMIDLPATKSTCNKRGTSAVTGSIELSGRVMTMSLKVAGEDVPCPDGDISYLPETSKFQGDYLDGGLPDFIVE